MQLIRWELLDGRARSEGHYTAVLILTAVQAEAAWIKMSKKMLNLLDTYHTAVHGRRQSSRRFVIVSVRFYSLLCITYEIIVHNGNKAFRSQTFNPPPLPTSTPPKENSGKFLWIAL